MIKDYTKVGKPNAVIDLNKGGSYTVAEVAKQVGIPANDIDSSAHPAGYGYMDDGHMFRDYEHKTSKGSIFVRVIYKDKRWGDSVELPTDLIDIARVGLRKDAYTKKTAQGYDVVSLHVANSGRLYAIIKRSVDYVVGAGYHIESGDWDQGYYGYGSESEARQALPSIAKRSGNRFDSKMKDSDKLRQLARAFAEMANYFDRANSARSRQFFEESMANELPKFYNLGLEVYNQLKVEIDAMKKAFASETYVERYNYDYDNEILSYIDDGASGLYWAGSNVRDKKAEILGKKILELGKEYRSLNGQPRKYKDSKVKDMGYRVPGQVIPEHQTYNVEYPLTRFTELLDSFVKQTIGQDATSGMKQIDGLLETVLKDYKADINNSNLDKSKTSEFYKKYKIVGDKILAKYRDVPGPVRDLIETRLYVIK